MRRVSNVLTNDNPNSPNDPNNSNNSNNPARDSHLFVDLPNEIRMIPMPFCGCVGMPQQGQPNGMGTCRECMDDTVCGAGTLVNLFDLLNLNYSNNPNDSDNQDNPDSPDSPNNPYST